MSCHYLLGKGGDVTRFVHEENRAWHAGVASWRRFSDINSLSIGVEIENFGEFSAEKHPPFQESGEWGSPGSQKPVQVEGSNNYWFPFSESQIQTLALLLIDFKNRWSIKDQFFLGHSDVSPQRKVDPGPLFPWKRLATDYKIGAWHDVEKPLKYITLPTSSDNCILWTQLRLRDYGYECPLTGEMDAETTNVVRVFQMHFRPQDISGTIDLETQKNLASLVDRYVYQE